VRRGVAGAAEVVQPTTRVNLERGCRDHDVVVRVMRHEAFQQPERARRVALLSGQVGERDGQAPAAGVVELVRLTEGALQPGIPRRQRADDAEAEPDGHHAVGVKGCVAVRDGSDRRPCGDRSSANGHAHELGLQEGVRAILVAGRDKVRERGGDHRPALVPLGRASMRVERSVEARHPQLVAQHVAKQLVIAVGVDTGRDNEQRRGVELPQDRRRVVVAGDRRARAGFELVENRCAQQEPLHHVWLARQHLFDQEVAHDAGASGEVRDEAIRVGLAPKRDRSHLHTRDPSIRAIAEQVQRLRGKTRTERVEQRVDLVERELQLGRTNLGAAASRAQPVERERRVAPAAGHNARAGRQAFDQPR
jgi:hypothetical protein